MAISRREVANQEPLAQRVLPVVIGTSTLAAAAGVMFLLPYPETVERPEDVYRDAEELNQPALPVPGAGTPPQANPDSSPTLTPLEAPSPAGATDPEEENADGNSEESDQSSIPLRQSAAIARNSSRDRQSAAQDPNQVSGLDGEAEIFDPVLLRSLNTALRDAIDESWSDRKAVEQDLEYRVGVSADGKVVGYRPVNQPAKEFGSDKLPLQKTLFNPVPAVEQGTQSDEPLAVFKVVLTDEGIPQVSPLRGFQDAGE